MFVFHILILEKWIRKIYSFCITDPVTAIDLPFRLSDPLVAGLVFSSLSSLFPLSSANSLSLYLNFPLSFFVSTLIIPFRFFFLGLRFFFFLDFVFAFVFLLWFRYKHACICPYWNINITYISFQYRKKAWIYIPSMRLYNQAILPELYFTWILNCKLTRT